MPTPTYTPLATVTLGTATASVTFSSIPATYRDLILEIVIQPNAVAMDNVFLRFNSDTGSNYPYVEAFGSGASVGGGSGTTTYFLLGYHGGGTAPTQIGTSILDYSATDKHKTGLVRNDKTGQGTSMIAARWANTAAITTVLVDSVASTFPTGSTLNLYGVIA
jgi:hypothetical protein